MAYGSLQMIRFMTGYYYEDIYWIKTSKVNVKKTECVAETSDITIGFICVS